jgi:MFS transporter, PAT family, beta-lactamase induction signal transducer AmpG
MADKKNKSPWAWIPSLYFAEGIPYIIVMFVASDLYKTMGISNAALAFWTSILYLPWVVKPLWSPYVDIVWTKRRWVIYTQLGLALAFFGVSLILQLPWWFPLSLVFLWLMAIVSATHDIAADGFYMLALDQHKQAFYSGIRSTFYRLAMIAGMGLLVIFTGLILDRTGLEDKEITVKTIASGETIDLIDTDSIKLVKTDVPEILIFPEEPVIPLYKEGGPDSTVLYIVLSAPPENGETVQINLGHRKGNKSIMLKGKSFFEFDTTNWDIPQKTVIKADHNLKEITEAVFAVKSGDIALSWTISIAFLGLLFLLFALYHMRMLPLPATDVSSTARKGYWEVLVSFFRKKGILASLIFLLFYRFAESQLTKMASPFLLDSKENGGLALSLTEKGFAYGTMGLIALLAGGILGGILAAKKGLKKMIWYMAIAINVPNVVYVYMSITQPDNLLVINSCVALEQFGYGFGFTAYMLYMLYLAGQGEHKTAHYALATGFMALGMMLPGMISGYVQEMLGYEKFFIYILFCTIPSFLTVLFIKIDPAFGLKNKSEDA